MRRQIRRGSANKKGVTRFIGAGLELGGKDPAYVRSDCNFEHAVENLVDGSYFNSGQSCCGIERIYVDESIFDNFVEAFKIQTEKYNLDNPLDESTNLGPVVKLSAANNIRNQVLKAINEGAKNIIDGSKFKKDNLENCYPKRRCNKQCLANDVGWVVTSRGLCIFKCPGLNELEPQPKQRHR